MKTVALFGGSFDPPHIGHIAIVDKLLSAEDISHVVVMPTYLNPLKKCFFAPATTRLKWLQTIFKNRCGVEVSDWEVKQNKKVPTIQTARMLLKSYDKVFVVIGADNFATLNRWQNYMELHNIVEFIVVTRDTIVLPKKLRTIPLAVAVSSTALRKQLQKEHLPKEVANEIEMLYKKEKNGHES